MPLKFRGGGTIVGNRANFGRGDRLAWFCGDHSADNKGGFPYGYRSPGAWLLGLKAGGLSSYNQLTGAGEIAPLNVAGGINGDATLSGFGDISSAEAQLVISMVATLAGIGTIASSDLRGYLNAVATLTGTGEISSTTALAALGWIVAAVNGSGTISNATPYASGELEATIRGYSDMTPEGIRDKVWDALLSQYQIDGSAGKALSNASSGGVDIQALVDAIMTDPRLLSVAKFLGLK